MKNLKILSAFLSIVLCLTAMPLTGMTSFAATSGDFEYSVLSETDKTCEVTGYTGTAINIIIPETINGYTVTSIGSNAFTDCDTLTSVIIPDSVMDIGDEAFAHCSNLENVVLPKKMEAIGYEAFKGTALKGELRIPEGITRMSSAFRATDITTLIIPKSVISMDPFDSTEGSFNVVELGDMQKLTNIVVSEDNLYFSSKDGVLFNKDQSMLLFYPLGNTNETYIIPSGVQQIGKWSIGNNYWGFCTHKHLKNIVIQDGLKEILRDTILTENLESITIPASIQKIDADAIFNGYADYTAGDDVEIPVTVRGYVGTEAQRYAEAQNYPFIALASYKDKATDIQVYTNEQTDSAFAQNTVLNSSVKETSDTKTVYDIFFTQNGGLIQPNTPVTVKIPVPASMNGADCKVYRQEADGTYTDMNAFYQNGYMVFTTDHFSVYVLTTGNPHGLTGDIDNNGTIDDWDSVLLDRYLAGWK